MRHCDANWDKERLLSYRSNEQKQKKKRICSCSMGINVSTCTISKILFSWLFCKSQYANHFKFQSMWYDDIIETCAIDKFGTFLLVSAVYLYSQSKKVFIACIEGKVHGSHFFPFVIFEYGSKWLNSVTLLRDNAKDNAYIIIIYRFYALAFGNGFKYIALQYIMCRSVLGSIEFEPNFYHRFFV